MVDKMTFSEVSEKVGISADKVRHWSKALGIKSAKIRGVCCLELSAIDALREMAVLVSNGISPQTAVATIKLKPQAAEMVVATTALVTIAPENTARLDALEKSVMLLIERLSRQEKEIAGQEKTIALQEEKIAALQSRAEFPMLLLSSPPRPVKPWQPVRVQPVPMPWYERLWLQMFNPETLRESTG